MSIDLAERHRTSEGPITTGFVDCDIHISLPSIKALFPYLSEQWRTHLETFGPRMRHGLVKGVTYAKSAPNASRRDAWPPNGGPPGSDLAFMREQYLDRYDVRCAMMNPLHMGEGYPNLDLGAAVCRAVNEWQIADWVSKDSRLRASIVLPCEDAPAAVAEIHRTSAEPGFAQALLLARTSEPLGRRRYWPIYEAAEERGLPIAIHVGGYGGHPVTSSGWPSYYIEDQNGVAQACLTTIASLVFEGVFERFPKLKFLVIEGGFAWLPSLSWRLDKHWRRLRSEVPHLKRPPSEYIRESVWVTTQPIEEPDHPDDLVRTINWIGVDRVLFATDYPHWDFDEPERVLPLSMPLEHRRQIFRTNALKLFGLA